MQVMVLMMIGLARSRGLTSHFMYGIEKLSCTILRMPVAQQSKGVSECQMIEPSRSPAC